MLTLDLLHGFCLLQEFDLHIVDRKGAENPVADNLSRLENVLDDPLPINDDFPDEQLNVISTSRSTPWYAVMLIILLLNLYHLASHTSKRKSFSMISDILNSFSIMLSFICISVTI